MNRIPKFRIWSTVIKRFITDLSLQNLGDYKGTLNDLFTNKAVIYQQWTGLTDKNGMDIYEGDILKYQLGSDIFNVIVKFGDCHWFIYDISFKCAIGYLTVAMKTYEVIGNILQNPELLEPDKKSPEEEMENFAKYLKNHDNGHQPC